MEVRSFKQNWTYDGYKLCYSTALCCLFVTASGIGIGDWTKGLTRFPKWKDSKEIQVCGLGCAYCGYDLSWLEQIDVLGRSFNWVRNCNTNIRVIVASDCHDKVTSHCKSLTWWHTESRRSSSVCPEAHSLDTEVFRDLIRSLCLVKSFLLRQVIRDVQLNKYNTSS